MPSAAFMEFANGELLQSFLCGKGPGSPGSQQMGHEPGASLGSENSNGSLGCMNRSREPDRRDSLSPSTQYFTDWITESSVGSPKPWRS